MSNQKPTPPVAPQIPGTTYRPPEGGVAVQNSDGTQSWFGGKKK